jgi:hypothetical protein
MTWPKESLTIVRSVLDSKLTICVGQSGEAVLLRDGPMMVMRVILPEETYGTAEVFWPGSVGLGFRISVGSVLTFIAPNSSTVLAVRLFPFP